MIIMFPWGTLGNYNDIVSWEITMTLLQFPGKRGLKGCFVLFCFVFNPWPFSFLCVEINTIMEFRFCILFPAGPLNEGVCFQRGFIIFLIMMMMMIIHDDYI